MPWDNPHPEAADSIAGERRQDRRYGIQLELRWKLIRRRRVLDTGAGSTMDLSSGGLRFFAGRHLPEGLNVEVSIAWPVLLHNIAPLQLVVAGRIVRCVGSEVAIRTVQYEFRTIGAPVDRRSMAAAASRGRAVLADSSVFTSLGKMH